MNYKNDSGKLFAILSRDEKSVLIDLTKVLSDATFFRNVAFAPLNLAGFADSVSIQGSTLAVIGTGAGAEEVLLGTFGTPPILDKASIARINCQADALSCIEPSEVPGILKEIRNVVPGAEMQIQDVLAVKEYLTEERRATLQVYSFGTDAPMLVRSIFIAADAFYEQQLLTARALQAPRPKPLVLGEVCKISPPSRCPYHTHT